MKPSIGIYSHVKNQPVHICLTVGCDKGGGEPTDGLFKQFFFPISPSVSHYSEVHDAVTEWNEPTNRKIIPSNQSNAEVSGDEDLMGSPFHLACMYLFGLLDACSSFSCPNALI